MKVKLLLTAIVKNVVDIYVCRCVDFQHRVIPIKVSCKPNKLNNIFQYDVLRITSFLYTRSANIEAMFLGMPGTVISGLLYHSLAL